MWNVLLMNDNEIGDLGGSSIGEGLKVNSTLTKLNLHLICWKRLNIINEFNIWW